MSYSFLSKPPQFKKRPVPVTVIPVAVPAEQVSPKTFTSIALWAQAVQPGTPAPRSPPSPYRVGRRGSVSSLRRPRRGSMKACSNPGSFLHIDTPTTISGPKNTPSVKDLTFDLTALGYTTVFVPLPKTPTTPSLSKPSSDSKSPSPMPLTPPPKTPSKAKTRFALKRIRSLGVLKPLRGGRNRSKSINSSQGPPSPKPASPVRARSKSNSKPKNLPPTLTNELLLLQFMDGGSLEKNMKRAMEKQAKKAAKHANTGERPVADVHRDGNGGFWRDQAEEMEYKPLLANTIEDDWVHFDDEDSAAVAPATVKTSRKRPAPLKLTGAASSQQKFADSFVPTQASN